MVFSIGIFSLPTGNSLLFHSISILRHPRTTIDLQSSFSICLPIFELHKIFIDKIASSMPHPDTNQTVPEAASSTVTTCCGDHDGADIVMPDEGSAKASEPIDAFASAREDGKDDQNKVPELVVDTTDHDQRCADSRHIADNEEAKITSSDYSPNSSRDSEDREELPELVADATDHEATAPIEQEDHMQDDLPPLVDAADSDLNVADPSTDTMFNDEDSGFNDASLSTNTILVDYGDSDLNVSNAASDIPIVDDRDSDLNVAEPSAETPLVNDEDSKSNAVNLSTNTHFLDHGDGFNATDLTINTPFFDEDSNINVVTPSADTPPTSVDTTLSDDDDMPDLVPGTPVYEDLPNLVDDRGSEPTLSHIGFADPNSFMVHDGQRCNRKASDCDKCTSIIEQQDQQFVQEMAAYCVKANEGRPDFAEELAGHYNKYN